MTKLTRQVILYTLHISLYDLITFNRPKISCLYKYDAVYTNNKKTNCERHTNTNTHIYRLIYVYINFSICVRCNFPVCGLRLFPLANAKFSRTRVRVPCLTIVVRRHQRELRFFSLLVLCIES